MSLPKSWMSFLTVPSTMVAILLPAACSRVTPQQAVDLLEDVGGVDEFAQVVLAGGEPLAHQLHPVLELFQDGEAGNPGREFGVDSGDDGRLVQIAQ